MQRDAAAVFAMWLAGDLGAEVLEQPFGVVAGGFRLDHRGLARRGKAGQQHRRFELRRGHRGFVGDRDRVGGALQRQRQPVAIDGVDDPRTHFGQRLEHAPHRPLRQRGIADEGRGHWASGHRAKGQPAAGGGIAEIERARRRGKAPDADAVNAPNALSRPFQPGAERAHGIGGMDDVLAFQQAADRAFADRQSRKDQGAVRDRLVAGYADAALKRGTTAGGQRRRGGGVHGAISLKVAPSYHAAAQAVISPLLARLGRLALLTGALQLAK